MFSAAAPQHERGGERGAGRPVSPLECLRLQGYDDDWLDGVGVGGRPLTDSDRYRLVGNAWPVPVASWIFERLLAYMEENEGSP